MLVFLSRTASFRREWRVHRACLANCHTGASRSRAIGVLQAQIAHRSAVLRRVGPGRTVAALSDPNAAGVAARCTLKTYAAACDGLEGASAARLANECRCLPCRFIGVRAH
jgi:hypothetical protein